MKSENPVQYILKTTTTAIIEELYCTGLYPTYKEAAGIFFYSAIKNDQATGFAMNDFNKFYQNYRKFKSLQAKQPK